MTKRIEQVDRVVGQNIRIFRNAKGMSQTELGSAIGVAFQQVQKYESGANRVGSSRLAKIAKALSTPISSLFDNAAKGADGPVAGPMVTDLLITPDAVRMLKSFAKLPSDHLRRSIPRRDARERARLTRNRPGLAQSVMLLKGSIADWSG